MKETGNELYPEQANDVTKQCGSKTIQETLKQIYFGGITKMQRDSPQ